MFNHAPENYKCPICLGVQGIESENTLLKQVDLVYKDDLVSVYINSFWLKTVEGHVIVVSNEHYENIYEMPEKFGHHIFDMTKKLAIAMKSAYQCDGITVRQNNEPASNQHAFHFHQHVFPRYKGDLYEKQSPETKFLSEPQTRLQYVEKLKDALAKT